MEEEEGIVRSLCGWDVWWVAWSCRGGGTRAPVGTGEVDTSVRCAQSCVEAEASSVRG